MRQPYSTIKVSFFTSKSYIFSNRSPMTMSGTIVKGKPVANGRNSPNLLHLKFMNNKSRAAVSCDLKRTSE